MPLIGPDFCITDNKAAIISYTTKGRFSRLVERGTCFGSLKFNKLHLVGQKLHRLQYRFIKGVVTQ